LLISLDALAERGWLNAEELSAAPAFPDRVDYGAVIDYHNHMLSKAWQGYMHERTPLDQNEFELWYMQHEWWVEDFALFMAIKESHGLSEWTSWPESEADYRKARQTAMLTHRARYEEHLFRQWVFDTQWQGVKRYANDKGIRLIGDIPIFVAHDSADVWSKRELFFLDSRGMPPVVTGVPPDSFNPEAGQRWGHPVYYWKRHADQEFAWWKQRVEYTLQQVDVVRIDHFRGFWDYFEVPATDLYTTKNGRWLDGPRDALFEALGAELMEHIIAEDLGDRMEEVIVWRERLGLPGMKILQFAFGGSEEEQARFGPDKMEANAVVYTGTHDNNTTLGWWQGESDDWQRQNMLRALERVGAAWAAANDTEPFAADAEILQTPGWQMLQLGLMSGGNTLVVPLQDVLGIDHTGRMNSPGDPDLSKNWRWRYREGDLTPELAQLIRALTEYYQRA
jgi:4-alpha-glucanotransferase